MREKHLAVGVFMTKISDDDQKIIFRTQRRRVAKKIKTQENFIFEHRKHRTNGIFVSFVFFVFNKIINVVLM